MARSYARIWLDINADDEFEALPFDAQAFYCRVILTLDDLSACGVADWRPRKLTTKAPDLSYPRILGAASALETGRYCLFDLDTEEVLARSFIRRDELLRNPKHAAAVVKAYNGIASKVLRAAVVTEIRRVRDEHPEYSSWTAKDKTTNIGEALSKLMAKPGLDEVIYTNQIGIPESLNIGNGIGNTPAVTEGITDANGNGYGDSMRIPSTYTHTTHQHPSGGYVTGERHQGATPDLNAPPPSRFCEDHPSGTRAACRDCESARKAFEAWERDRDIAAAARRAEIRDAIDHCGDCDQYGRLIDQSDCPKHPNFRQEVSHA
ncbi:hypothetical protein QYF68_26700 [Mycolicibacterium austroafricanum]|uniref:Uncharacterized protein n=1 Tax=Mycolicibacterium austroafricanum TaxID=39687 RepID=A0ABT8HKX2_MYCAO|nr:hypothetical protein [Mycolicibacterium austroafricanum]MDN4521384.1 hypothetical protein [Mycolicibacterium austroafricanum]